MGHTVWCREQGWVASVCGAGTAALRPRHPSVMPLQARIWGIARGCCPGCSGVSGASLGACPQPPGQHLCHCPSQNCLFHP